MKLGLTRLARRITGVVTSLTASTITRTSPATTYPPTVSFTRPIDWSDTPTMYAVMQWSTDYTFATGVTETATPQVITAAVTTYNFGLSAIVSGVYYMRLGAWRGTRPGSLNWSNLQGVGDAVAPTITGGTATTPNNAVMAVTVTASEVSYFTIGGVDGAAVEKVGTEPATSITVRLVGNANTSYLTKGSYTFTVTPTDVSGNVGSAATFVRNVAAPMVLDAANKISVLTLSNGSKTMTGAAGQGASQKIRSTNPVSGKGYFEFRMDTKSSGGSPGVGLVRASYAAYSDYTNAYATADAVNAYFRDTFTNIDGPSNADIDVTATLGAAASGSIIGVAFDTTALLMWVSINNVWYGNPAAGTLGRTIPTGTVHVFANAWNADVMTFRPDAASQTYAAPSGFTAIGA